MHNVWEQKNEQIKRESLHTHTQTIIIMLYMLSYPKKEEGREREGGRGKQVKTLEFLLFWGDL